MENLQEKLKGMLPVTKEELFELVSSWGRTDDFITKDGIKIEKCEPNECYDLSYLDVSEIINLSNVFKNSNFDGNISKWDFNKNVECTNMFVNNFDFMNKFNNGNEIPNNTNDFIKWFYLELIFTEYKNNNSYVNLDSSAYKDMGFKIPNKFYKLVDLYDIIEKKIKIVESNLKNLNNDLNKNIETLNKEKEQYKSKPELIKKLELKMETINKEIKEAIILNNKELDKLNIDMQYDDRISKKEEIIRSI